MPLNYARGCQELERLIPSILITRLLLLQVEITKLQLPKYIFLAYSLYIITCDYLFKWYRYDYFYHIMISICCFINYFKLKNLFLFVIFICFSFFNYFSYVSGNLVTVIALLKYTRLRRHATTAFVISLSISDLIFSAVNLPLTASRYLNEAWVLGETLCKIFPLFFYGNVAVSLLSMVAITINRLVILINK